MEDNITYYEAQISTLQSEKTSLQNQVTQKDTTIQSLQSQIGTLQSRVDQLQDEIDRLNDLIPPQPPKEGETGSSRFFPADIGTSLTVNYEYPEKTGYTAIITVTQVIRGEAAWAMIYQANMFNSPPPSDYEYILVKIRWQYIKGPSLDTSENINKFIFEIFSQSYVEYAIPIMPAVEPSPAFSTTLYPGASYEGWATFTVSKTDGKPLLVFARHPDGSGGVWFKLY